MTEIIIPVSFTPPTYVVGEGDLPPPQMPDADLYGIEIPPEQEFSESREKLEG
jgi:hypothetical protein